jgi:mevalonate kinase
MKWSIPAKTFFLGEYAAIAKRSAILVTTTPCFEVTLTEQKFLDGIHPESPGGLWWNKQSLNHGLSWYDPYQGCGGLGASSAQFVGSYLASCLLNNTTPKLGAMLEVYYQCAWNGQGLRPSGYDLIAQAHYGCVFINRLKNHIQSYSWPFADLSFFLIHTGIKLATHHHLQETALPLQIEPLSTIVDNAKTAFEQGNSNVLIQCVNSYHAQLEQHHLVSQHSLKLINEFRSFPEVLAIKGCGALGADTLLLLTRPDDSVTLKIKLEQHHKTILASDLSLAQKNQTHQYLIN